MKRVIIFDPYVGGFNTGDLIIRQSVLKHLKEINENIQVYFLSLHQHIRRMHWKRVANADLVLVAGSNMLSGRHSFLFRNNRWAISLLDIPVLKGKVVLVGVGVNKSELDANFVGKYLYKRVLAPTVLQSVRDSHALEFVRRRLGLSNVVNTSCPTLWDVSDSAIPWQKGRRVVATLTDYSADPEKDKVLLKVLRRQYEEVFFWPQGFNDVRYLQAVGPEGIHILRPDLDAYDELLRSNPDLDYVGTRLHGGIRALQHGRRTIIVSIDHRSKVIAKDVGLIVIDRTDDEHSLESTINEPRKLRLSLPVENIRRWKQALAGILA